MPAALRLAALVLAALPLAGCAGPAAQARLELLDVQVLPQEARNETLLHALVRVHAEGGAIRQQSGFLWVVDAARDVLVVAQPVVLDVGAGGFQDVNFTQAGKGIAFPFRFRLDTQSLDVSQWPPIEANAFPFGSRPDTGNASWGFRVPYFGDRLPFHFVVDDTNVSTPPRGTLEGTLRVAVNDREAFSQPVSLAPGAHLAKGLVLRTGDRVQVTWSGARADVLIFASDPVMERYRLAAGG